MHSEVLMRVDISPATRSLPAARLQPANLAVHQVVQIFEIYSLQA
jgi:hypothetical protein